MNDDYSQIVASVLNSVQIFVFNYLYNYVASALTLQENHRTDTEYEDALVAKLFLFQVNIDIIFIS